MLCTNCKAIVDDEALFCPYCAFHIVCSSGNQQANALRAPVDPETSRMSKQSTAPYLLGTVGSITGRKFPIEGGRIFIGRDASQCQIILPQAVISKCHAALEINNELQVTLVDLACKHSTFVNGQPITQKKLSDGDRVGFGFGGVVAFTFHTPVSVREEVSSNRSVASGHPDHQINRSAHTDITPPLAPLSLVPVEASLAQEPGFRGTMILRAAKVPTIRLGRAPDNDFVLGAPSVSRHHALLTYGNGAQPVITDLGSTNGTFVNGELLGEPRQLSPHDLVFLGGFLLHVDGRTIKQHDLSSSTLTARNITKEIGGKTILKDVSMVIYPREFIGLMGSSGCGKSTLMDALNGLRPATTGNVFVNDLDLYQNFNALRRSIGYVPQRDILHDALTVERTLFYAARLRLPPGMSADRMRNIISEVIDTVSLSEQRHTPFRQLSGGQQKRLSLALELITKPSFIFLDEPTSPLDPETTENMMLLFRRLADEGRIVVMVTHKFEKFREMHHIAMLTRGGRLAYFGPPIEALEYFGCKEPGDIYRHMGARDPDELSNRFRESRQHHRYVRARIAETEQLARTTGALQLAPAMKQEGPERRLGVSQWLTLTRRYLEVKLKDRRNTLILLAQAPIVAILLAIIVGDSVNDSKTLFIAAIISIWFGANNAVREIVSEAAIYTRERLINLKIPSYVFSKVTVLTGIALIQCLVFVGIIAGMGRLKTGDFFSLTLILYLTSLAGIAMGLFFSALVNSTEKAMSVLPLILIPQLLLSGYIMPIDDVYFTQSMKPASSEQFQHFEKTKNLWRQPQGTPARVATPALPEAIFKRDGLKVARYLSTVIAARWTIEALAHDVSIDDRNARDKLAANIEVVEYGQVFEGKPEETITSVYRRRVALDCGLLTLFNVVFLGLTMWALKRKDVL